MRILTLDPGGSTGLCVFDTETNQIQFTVFDQDWHHKTLFEVLAEINADVTVYEAFDHREKAALLISVEYIGVIRLWSQINEKTIVSQRPTDVKGQWPNSVLKRVLKTKYKFLSAHEKDAVRHLMWYVTNQMKDNRFVVLGMPRTED
jgi:hypothetical protein